MGRWNGSTKTFLYRKKKPVGPFPVPPNHPSPGKSPNPTRPAARVHALLLLSSLQSRRVTRLAGRRAYLFQIDPERDVMVLVAVLQRRALPPGAGRDVVHRGGRAVGLGWVAGTAVADAARCRASGRVAELAVHFGFLFATGSVSRHVGSGRQVERLRVQGLVGDDAACRQAKNAVIKRRGRKSSPVARVRSDPNPDGLLAGVCRRPRGRQPNCMAFKGGGGLKAANRLQRAVWNNEFLLISIVWPVFFFFFCSLLCDLERDNFIMMGIA